MWRQAKRKLLIGALKSEYAKRTYDFIPTWLISYIMRLFVDFMLYYRLRLPVESLSKNVSLYYASNLFISVLISVIVTMCSPFLYDVVWQYEKHIKKFTNQVANNMSWQYFYIWQTRIVVALSILGIIILSRVELTSIWLIECIIHTLICGFILSKYEELREYLSTPKIVYWNQTICSANIKPIVDVKSACKIIRYYSDSLIEDYLPPKRATIVNIDVLKKKFHEKQKNNILIFNNVQINIFTDYCGKN